MLAAQREKKLAAQRAMILTPSANRQYFSRSRNVIVFGTFTSGSGVSSSM